MQTLIIDNYDSYTFNLYQMIAEVNGKLPLVIYNDRLNWDELKEIAFDNIVISPGPGRPERSEDFGVCRQIIENADVPLLGVCLGHQGLGYLHGARVIHAPEVRHGRLSKIYHNNSELFQGIPSNFSVVRYHSLLVANELPECLEKTAWTEEGLVMGLHHRHLPFWGVQFHPESICTEYGQRLIANFRDITLKFIERSSRRQEAEGKRQDSATVASPQASAGGRRGRHPQGAELENLLAESKSPQKQYWIEYGSVTPVMARPRQEQEQKFELYTRKLDICPSTEQIFVQLFGDAANAFWLDSSRVELGLSRFSFMGDGSGANSLLVRYHTQTQELIITQSDIVTRRTESIFEYLKREIDCRFCQSDELPFDLNCGFVGYFGYELKAECGSLLVHSSPLPDAIFLLADRMIAIDHQEQCLYLLQLIKKGQTEQVETWFDTIQQQLENLDPLFALVPQENCQPVKFRLSRTYQNYIQDIQQCLDEIHEGETYQVCLTNQLYTDATPDPLTFYRTLRKINPAPYSAFLRFGKIAIACSSPERFLRINRQGCVETKPIKGTLPRGETPEADFVLREKLRNSEKDRAENLMIVDLLRNDLGRVCEVGSIHVPKLMDVETYSTVHQLVTTIRGRLRSELQAVDCVRAAFPGGSMTGAPKIRTMQIIDRLEQEARGVYSGAIGFLGLNGSADLNIVIRTAVLTPNRTSIGIGGGIIALSEPEMEFQETLLKAKALIDALLLTMHGTSEPDMYPILGLEATTADSYEKLSA